MDGGEADVTDGNQSREPDRGGARPASLASCIASGGHTQECSPCDKSDNRTHCATGCVREHRASRCEEFCDIGRARQRDTDQGNEWAFCRPARERRHVLIVPQQDSRLSEDLMAADPATTNAHLSFSANPFERRASVRAAE